MIFSLFVGYFFCQSQKENTEISFPSQGFHHNIFYTARQYECVIKRAWTTKKFIVLERVKVIISTPAKRRHSIRIFTRKKSNADWITNKLYHLWLCFQVSIVNICILWIVCIFLELNWNSGNTFISISK